MSKANRRAHRRTLERRIATATAKRRRRYTNGIDNNGKMPRITRRDRQALWPTGGWHHRDKHFSRRHEKVLATQTQRLQHLTGHLAAITRDHKATVTDIDFCGSSTPYIATGTATINNIGRCAWSFRYRYDRASLEVGTERDDEPGLIGECFVSASIDDVTGNPYAGHLTDEAAILLIGRLFEELDTDGALARFSQRLATSLTNMQTPGNQPSP